MIIIWSIINWNKQKQESINLLQKAELSLNNNKIDEAIKFLKESEKMYSNKDNKSYILEKEINNFNSPEFLKNSLIKLTNKEFENLQNNNFNKSYFNNDFLNKKFIELLKSNLNKRQVYLDEIDKEKHDEEIKKKQEEIDKKIKSQFSEWDWSHIALSNFVKKNLKDPKSYEHIETTYSITDNTIVVLMKYRAKNSFWWYVIESIKAYYDLDWNPVNIENWVQS